MPSARRCGGGTLVGTLWAMSPHARGELWLWSDADVIAAPGTLGALRRELARPGAAFVTCPYAIERESRGLELLDKLFADVELLPGVLLLGRLDRVRFGLGSGVFFEAERFRRQVDWPALGADLADDYQLGCRLGAGRLAPVRLETVPASRRPWPALLHYLRWQKTIRWCRPGGYAAKLLVLPVLPALATAVALPASAAAGGVLAGVRRAGWWRWRRRSTGGSVGWPSAGASGWRTPGARSTSCTGCRSPPPRRTTTCCSMPGRR